MFRSTSACVSRFRLLVLSLFVALTGPAASADETPPARNPKQPVNVPTGSGHVVLFSINPVYRGETRGTYALVLNAILDFDNLSAGATEK